MTPRDRPPFYWCRSVVTRAKRSRAGHDHFFRDDQQRAACGPHLIPNLKGTRSERLRTGPPTPNACSNCVRAWRSGWPHDQAPQETTTT